MNPNRIPKLLRMVSRFVDLERASGLEIGPLDTPVFRRPDHRIKYLDFCTAAELRARLEHNTVRNSEEIVEVDFVLQGRSLKETVAGERFDFLFGSHVIEHVPDVIGWLQDAADILTPGGKIFLLVPDRRFTFDLARPCTTLGRFIENHLSGKTIPSIADAVDHLYYAVKVRPALIWAGSLDYAELCTRTPLTRSRIDALAEQCRTTHVDRHCNVFTRATFHELVTELHRLDFHPFEIEAVGPLEAPQPDFFCCLSKQAE